MEEILALAARAGFTRAVPVNMAALTVRREVREMCADGRCLMYGRRWSCPPACGTPEVCQARMAAYGRGVLVQTTGALADDFDAQAIDAIRSRHKTSFDTLARQTRLLCPDCLPLTAGACTLCRACTYPDRPCRFPGKRLSSMEAYGLLVSDVCSQSGVGYYYGPKTMTYTSCILF